jgi:hypothetical protein
VRSHGRLRPAFVVPGRTLHVSTGLELWLRPPLVITRPSATGLPRRDLASDERSRPDAAAQRESQSLPWARPTGRITLTRPRRREWGLTGGQGQTPALTAPPHRLRPGSMPWAVDRHGAASLVLARRVQPAGMAPRPLGACLPAEPSVRPTPGRERRTTPPARPWLRWHDRRSGWRPQPPGLVEVREAANDVGECPLKVGVDHPEPAHLARIRWPSHRTGAASAARPIERVSHAVNALPHDPVDDRATAQPADRG